MKGVVGEPWRKKIYEIFERVISLLLMKIFFIGVSLVVITY